MKFSIRDLLLVTALVALALGWCVDHCRLVANSRWQDVTRDSEMARDQLTRGNIKALEKKLDSLDPAWRLNLPDSRAPTPNPPKP